MGRSIILLVEDDADDELLTTRALRRSKVEHELAVARDGVEALEYLFGKRESTDELPRLILLDLKLPRLSGFDVLRRLREDERTCVVPVVVLTSSSEESDIMESYRLGANSYVRKAVDAEQFSRSILEVGRYWLLVNETRPR